MNFKNLKVVLSILVVLLLINGIAFSVDKPVYKNLPPDVFMKKWLITEPIPVLNENEKPTSENQEKAFAKNALSPENVKQSIDAGKLVVDGKSHKWKMIDVKTDAVDLINVFEEQEYVYSYAYAEIKFDAPQKMILGVGSDDGIQIWLNGEKIHDFWIGRPVVNDADLVAVHFKEGVNTLLLKIQNQQHGWGFSCRPLSKTRLTELLVEFSGDGRMDNIQKIVENTDALDLNKEIGPGLSAVEWAKVHGRKAVVDYLVTKGASTEINLPPSEKIVDYIFNKVVTENYPGAALLLSKNGEIIFETGYGMANIKKQKEITPETTFRIGSVTKQFTASAILKLWEEGKLSLDNPLSKYIPDFPRGDEVTIHHLLTHTSGIHSYTSETDFMDRLEEPISQDELIDKIKSFEYDFTPGEKWLYNNSGYYLLGFIIEKITGEPYEKFWQREFFKPLGMENTGVYRKGLDLKNEAIGYSFSDNKVEVAVDWDMSRAGGAGNLYSNVHDLYKWNENVFNGKVLSIESMDLAFTPVKLNSGEVATTYGNHYGYGWGLRDFRGLKMIGHGGGLHGFSTYLCRFTDLDVTVAVIANCVPSIPGMNTEQMSLEIGQIYFWEQMKEQESFVAQKIDTTILQDYIGRYDYGNAVLTVTEDDGHLYAQMVGQPKFEIFPTGNDEFFWKVVEASVRFVRNEEGVVTYAMHRQGGMDLKAPKLEQEEAVEVDEKILENYVGNYQLAPDVIVSVTRQGDQLFSQLTGQPALKIYPRSETAFFLKEVNATVEFIRKDGKVDGLIIYQAGRQNPAKRIND